jgi:hypothetical protein
MYACVHKTGVGFFEAVCTLSNATANFHDPPPPRFALHLCGLFDPFTTEKLYFYVYVRYESRLNQCPYPPFPFPPIPPIRALALKTQTVPLSDPRRNPCLNRLRDV